MVASALTPLGSSNIAQDEYVEDLGIVTIYPWCEEVPSNISEDYSSGDVVCTLCGLVLADHIIDTGPELRSSSDNYSPSPDYSLSEYSASDYPDSDSPSSHYSSSDYADRDYQG
jgi:hypothetical protein